MVAFIVAWLSDKGRKESRTGRGYSIIFAEDSGLRVWSCIVAHESVWTVNILKYLINFNESVLHRMFKVFIKFISVNKIRAIITSTTYVRLKYKVKKKKKVEYKSFYLYISRNKFKFPVYCFTFYLRNLKEKWQIGHLGPFW